MSKKLAEGLTGLVLDVKYGSGAFLPELERGLELARTMIDLGVDHGCPVVALLTAMDRPLGRACGNALEVEESIMALRGEGPPDLMAVVYALGAEMLLLGGAAPTRDDARRRMEVAISSGQAAAKFQEILEAQGGDPRVVDDPSLLPQAPELDLFLAPRAGVVSQVEPRAIGRGITLLGGGRTRVEDAIDPAVGFVVTARPGDIVRQGEPLATVYARDRAGLQQGLAVLHEAIHIGDDAERPLPLISHRVTAGGVEVYDGD
jgi:pyrimidine-nucleoside phosphorylase